MRGARVSPANTLPMSSAPRPSSLSQFFVRRNWDIFLGNLDRYSSGKTLLNELTPEQLEGR